MRSVTDPDGSDGATVNGIRESVWNAGREADRRPPAQRATPATLEVTSPDGVAGSVRFDLVDAVGSYVGSAVIEVGAEASRLRSLSDLFRNLQLRPGPFRVLFDAAPIRFARGGDGGRAGDRRRHRADRHSLGRAARSLPARRKEDAKVSPAIRPDFRSRSAREKGI